MVNLTAFLCKYIPVWYPRGDSSFNTNIRFLKKNNLLKLTFNLTHRNRNCYRLARRKWIKSLQIEQDNRKEKAVEMRDLFSQRIFAACEEHRFPYKYFLGVLPQMGIELDRKVLAHMAIWEPRSFASLIQLCQAKVATDPVGEAARNLEKPAGVITRGMI